MIGGCFAFWVVVSCSTSHRLLKESPSERTGLTAVQAAILASELANERCAQLYGIRPFKPNQYVIERCGSRWRWGGLDVKAESGFSAEVVLEVDGTESEVDVYFSNDMLLLPPEVLPAEDAPNLESPSRDAP